MRYEELTIEGRNAVLEAFRSGKTIDKVFVLEGCQDGPIKTILREAKKHGTMVKFVSKDRLDNMSETKKHQGVIAYAAAYNYATVEDILAKAEEAILQQLKALQQGDFTEEELDTIIATQAKAPFLFSQAVAANMKKRKSGCILFISSLASILGMHDIQAYTLCKSGVKGLTRSLSRDLGPYGIRVNSLNPGFVYTDMLAKTNLKTPERLEEIQNRTPLRGFAKEKDLGMAAAFLCSDAARFISGIDLVVDGGISSSFLL